jgi:hypothetical protein
VTGYFLPRMYRTRLRNMMKIAANSGRRMNWIAMERSVKEITEKMVGGKETDAGRDDGGLY